MRRPGVILFALITLACSSLPSVDGGVVDLEVRSPIADTLVQGDTLKLRGRALNAAGDSVNAVIIWRTADTLLVSVVDSFNGVIVALSDTGTARVQAAVGTLRSDVVSILLVPDTTTSTGVRTVP